MAGQNPADVRIAITGRLLTAPLGTTAPTDVTTAWPTGWNDHGLLDPSGVSQAPKTTPYMVKAWQADSPVRTRIVERGRDIQVKLIQGGGLNSVLYNGGGSWSALGTANIASPTYTATTAVDSGAAYTVNGLVGKTVIAGASTMVITSNTATTLTGAAWIGGTPTAGTPFVISSGIYQYTPPTPGVDDIRMLGVEWKDGVIIKRDIYTNTIVSAVAPSLLQATKELTYDVTFTVNGDVWYTLSNDPADNPAALVA